MVISYSRHRKLQQIYILMASLVLIIRVYKLIGRVSNRLISYRYNKYIRVYINRVHILIIRVKKWSYSSQGCGEVRIL